MKNLANKLTISRMILGIIIMLLLGLPWSDFNISWPTYLLGGKIVLRLNYLISAVLFIIASFTDLLDGKIARKNNEVSDYGKVMDAIADKILVNGVLIILAYNHDIALIIPVIVVLRDTVVDAIKMLVGNKSSAVGASIYGKIKTIVMMCGITLVLLGNLPLEYFGIALDQGLIIIATILSIYSGLNYYFMYKDTITK